ncbi:hypothetical protein [Nocardioides sp. SYSU D00038]|uniref:hypothetical protein n=1 Tax=Nocardioides sp. SYSU D00038 TaxID=2812554 RepID=UPI001967D29A|nr:hypothetical protein [Nocardioides sp. SYSU D00038]
MTSSVLGRGLRQPDQRSCGAACLVAARMVVDPDYAELVNDGRHPVTGLTLPGTPAERFGDETLAMHRRVTGLVDVQGALQLPWPRVVGTPPWAVARQLSATSGPGLPAVDHDVHVTLGDLGGWYDRVLAAVTDGRPVPLYVGDRWLPRHVVLAVGGNPRDLRVHDPARGAVVAVPRRSFETRRLPFGRWTRPWFVVLPESTG